VGIATRLAQRTRCLAVRSRLVRAQDGGEGPRTASKVTRLQPVRNSVQMTVAPTGATPITDVVCAVIERADGSFLLAQRPEGKPYSGYWEFPGGKIEAGETRLAALTRELDEELGITVETAYPWITRMHVYTHATVRLFFFRVVKWRGEPHGRENQAFEWQTSGTTTVAPMLPANTPILAALALPKIYAISNAGELGVPAFLARLDAALERGLRLIQFREKVLEEGAARALLDEVVRRSHAQGARVLVNSAHAFAYDGIADGIHLTASDLLATKQGRAADLCGASCHNTQELAQAMKLACDFAVLGPVLATASHPSGAILDWAGFGEVAAGAAMPVYALGGMQEAHLPEAWAHGAHGIAMMRAPWG
jgi:8-oxo-dGTP diphosphatase